MSKCYLQFMIKETLFFIPISIFPSSSPNNNHTRTHYFHTHVTIITILCSSSLFFSHLITHESIYCSHQIKTLQIEVRSALTSQK